MKTHLRRQTRRDVARKEEQMKRQQMASGTGVELRLLIVETLSVGGGASWKSFTRYKRL